MQIVLDPETDGVVVVHVLGRLDFSGAQEASTQFGRAVAHGEGKVVVDLSQVEFLDSAGLGTLIGAMRLARQAGGDLYIAAPPKQVQTILSLTSVDQLLKIHPTVGEAVHDFSR
jgi:anti-sigma B factor antagonist